MVNQLVGLPQPRGLYDFDDIIGLYFHPIESGDEKNGESVLGWCGLHVTCAQIPSLYVLHT